MPITPDYTPQPVYQPGEAGVTVPQGFSSAATTAGIKPSGNPDMVLLVNDGPDHHAHAMFTRNQVVAAPVKLTRANNDGTFKAVLVNSGNANACNGARGDQDARDSVAYVAERLGIDTADVAVCSTGLIGDPLPMDKIYAGIDALTPALGSEITKGNEAARAIMTTDTVVKESVYRGDGWSIGAMGKGVGMMAPSLATMLIFITTDASFDSAEPLRTALSAAAETTFDCIDIDGSTSTNDTVLLLSSGASGVTPDVEEFAAAVQRVCTDLAMQLQSDAEGVSKRVAITVEGARNNTEAKEAARVLGRDNLFKCAMFGSDPNWGRVLAAVGMAPVEMNPEGIAVSFNGQPVCVNSTGAPGARDVDLSGIDIAVTVNLGVDSGQAPGKATVWTTDLSYEYVAINAEYSS